MNLTKKRWVILAACCFINLCIGSLYAWSVFAAPMADHLQALSGGDAPNLAVIFTIANGVGPITMISGGALQGKFGPRRVILLGGLLFGLVLGSIYTFLGAMLNCALMFLISRRLGRGRMERYIRQKLPPVWQARLRRAGGRQGFWLLVVLRLIPAVPYNLINYAFGLTSMGFPQYLLASAVGIIPGTLVFINIGDKALAPSAPTFWIAIGLLVLLLAVTALLGRRLFPDTTENGEET